MDCSVEGIIEITTEYKKIIEENDGLMVLIIVTSWCGNCQIMAPVLQNLAYQYRGKIKFVMIDAETSNEITEDQDLSVLPLFQFFNGNKLVDQVNGTLSSNLLNEKMKALIEVSSKNQII